MQRSLTRNLRLYPWYLCLTWEGMSNAVWYLYLFSFKGLSLGQMAWLVLLGDGVIALAEVPTGWIADRIGRRRSLLIGIMLQGLSAGLFIAGQEFWTFWLAMAVCGLGDTFRSGADEALLFDSCRGSGQVPAFRRILSRSLAIATIAMVGSQIAGGVIATRVSWTLPFWLEIVMSAGGFMVVLAMLEAPHREVESPRNGNGQRSGRSLLIMSLTRLLPLLLFAAIVEIVPELSHFHLPAELDAAIGLTPEQLAYMYAGFELLQGLGNYLAGRLRIRQPLAALGLVGLGFLAMLLLMGCRAWLGLAVYLLARGCIDLFSGFARPIISEQANLRTASSVRATTLSILNAAKITLPLSLLPISSSLMQAQGAQWMYTTFAACLLLPMLAAVLWLMKQVRTAAAVADEAG